MSNYAISSLAVVHEKNVIQKERSQKLASSYLKDERILVFISNYARMAISDGDGCTDLERRKICELVAEQIHELTYNQYDVKVSGGDINPQTRRMMGLPDPQITITSRKEKCFPALGLGQITPEVVSEILDSVLYQCKKAMILNEEPAAIRGDLESLEKCFEGLVEVATVDGAISSKQLSFLHAIPIDVPFPKKPDGPSESWERCRKEAKQVNKQQLIERSLRNGKSRLQAVAYLLMVLGFWDLDGITDEESAKIGELLLQWDETLNEESLQELFKKCELSYEKDTREQNTEEVIRSAGFLCRNLNAKEQMQFIAQMEELAAVDGPIAEQQQAFIQWAWEEITA